MRRVPEKTVLPALRFFALHVPPAGAVLRLPSFLVLIFVNEKHT
jgi:hypothetical protein